MVTAIDGQSFATRLDFMDRVASYDKGEEVELTIERDGEERTVKTLIQPLSSTSDRVGLGIFEPLPVQTITEEPPVTFDLTNVGGPSAGLMFSLELYDQLTPGIWRMGASSRGRVRSTRKAMSDRLAGRGKNRRGRQSRCRSVLRTGRQQLR